jgi:hypothetical protein
MKKHMSRKPSRRGPGHIQRSKSGGSVRGKIPHPGGSNKTNFNTGVSVTKFGVTPKAKVKPAPKPARQVKVKHV